MSAETTISPAVLQETLDRGARYLYDILQARADKPTASRDDVLVAEAALRHWQSLAAVAAVIEREAALVARNAELERLCDATYVAKGADAYNHACETMAAWQKARAKAEKDAGCEGSLCDGLSWLQSRVDSLEAERDALAERVKAMDADAERLNWFDENGFTAYRAIDPIDGLSIHCVVVRETMNPRRGCVADTIRDAIDAARAEARNG